MVSPTQPADIGLCCAVKLEQSEHGFLYVFHQATCPTFDRVADLIERDDPRDTVFGRDGGS
jgi:hypothetical protein